MPRKHRAARERAGPPPPGQQRLAAPEWALVGWADVRAVTGDKVYRCPGCDHEIRAGRAHDPRSQKTAEHHDRKTVRRYESGALIGLAEILHIAAGKHRRVEHRRLQRVLAALRGQ